MSSASERTQANRSIGIETALGGNDPLLLTSFEGREEMSRLFSYRLGMVSESESIAIDRIVGTPVSFYAKAHDDSKHYWNGVVRKFRTGARIEETLRYYEADIVPWCWFLTQTTECRIFQNKSTLEIVEQIFTDRDCRDYDMASVNRAGNVKREFCVQYRESDFDFISRLLEEEGIFYFFKHEQGKHTMVLADETLSYQKCAQYNVEYRPGSHTASRIFSWDRAYEFLSGVWTYREFNHETPADLLTVHANTVVELPDTTKYERFDYPGRFQESSHGKALAKVCMESLEAAHDTAVGKSDCMSFAVGGLFKFKGHEFKSEDRLEYAITAIEHSAKDDTYYTGARGAREYGNSFSCVPSKVPFRPAQVTPKPHIRGPQTAIVVGPKGEEIYIDDQARVKVQFHWDREGESNETSSCWVRVAQQWAGQGWGFLFHPRIGQEVIVEFLEGNPDRPIITGRVYNGQQTPVKGFNDAPTQSSIRTHSSPKGEDKDFNELRFEDKKGKEQVYFHAERDFERYVENNDKLKVGFDVKDAGDQTIDIYNNRTVTVHEGDCQLQVKKKDHKILVDAGNQAIEIAKDQTVEIGESQTIDIGKNQTIDIGENCTLEAGKSIVLKVGGNSVTIDSKGVTVVGTKIGLEGKSKATVKAAAVDVAGSIKTTVKGGAMMDVSGGMTAVKGGVVKIN